MKKLLVSIVFVALLGAWLVDWVSSGKMDAFLKQHPNPDVTPALLSGMGSIYQVFHETKSAAHYYRWLVEDYPRYRDIARVRYELAECYQDNAQKDLAMEQYTILKDSFSRTSYGELGQRKYDQTRF